MNLIGEHIDYHDLPVLPMALERAAEIEFTPRTDGVVQLSNRDGDFDALTVPVSPDPPRGPTGDWGNYVRAAVATVAALDPSGAFGGLEGEVHSTLPPAAGLSSSSALVVATAKALLATHRDPGWQPPPATDLAGLLAHGERYVGTEGGGMDQAASLGGRTGHVLRISFNPVAWATRPLPEGWAVLVAHSGVRAEKSGRAQAAYNSLRARGEDAKDELARELGVEADYRSLRSAVPTDDLVYAASRLTGGETAAVAIHVLREADRVDDAWEALARSDMEAFGSAMNASHTSLAERCKVSHPRLDELVAAARAAGAAGARLTGAGFGGCMIALAPEEGAESVLAALRTANRKAGFDEGAAPVFRARPGAGAAVGTTGSHADE